MCIRDSAKCSKRTDTPNACIPGLAVPTTVPRLPVPTRTSLGAGPCVHYAVAHLRATWHVAISSRACEPLSSMLWQPLASEKLLA
eukprot:1986543-Prymnesium_polylepis.1